MRPTGTLSNTPISISILLILALTAPASASQPSWQGLMAAGKEASREERYPDSERDLRRALELAESFGESDPRLPETLNELGYVLRIQGRNEDALPLYERAHRLSLLIGKNDPEVATSLIGLAAIAGARGNLAEARSNFKAALKLRQKIYPAGSPEVARCQYAYGYFCLTNGDLDQARRLLEPAVESYHRSSGDRPEFLALSLGALARLDAAQQRISEATKHFEEAVEVGESVLGNNHSMVAFIKLDFGIFKFGQNDLSGGTLLYETALPVLESHKVDLTYVAGCEVDLAQAYVRLERYDDAERLLKAALPVLSTSNTADPTQVKEAQDLAQWIKDFRAGRLPTYETRYVNGVPFQIGSFNDIQVWLTCWKGKDLQALVYVVNGSDHAFTFFPGAIAAQAITDGAHGSAREDLHTYTAEEYESKVRNANMWRAFAAGLATAFNNTPEPQTTTTSGQYQMRDQDGTTYGSYYGTITRWPTQADYQAANDRSRAQLDAMTSQLQASYQAISSSLMRNQTLDAHAYYGGTVFIKQSGNSYEFTIPADGTAFQFALSFPK